MFTTKAVEGETYKKHQTEKIDGETEDRQTHEDTRLTKLLLNSASTRYLGTYSVWWPDLHLPCGQE